ncbi:CheR family methyltransferase [Limisphaera ngatamarikiensis]|uniref:CheR family methyltransferase n=1 Tax=Limisphaera ngatamarikiensis TaxID=1324935 RepID=UPI001981776A|nr:protein-glutamate O-methyltransferase CheR [Limisphaera ngatamarikiensis]
MKSVRSAGVSAISTDSLSAEDFEFIRRWVFDAAGITLGPEKRSLVVHRLLKRVRQLNLGSLSEYCALLRRPGAEEERGIMLDLLTTNVTHFFRESAHFDFLAREILAKEWAGPHRPVREFVAWSAACSSGEEPYSIALILAEHERRHPGFRWRVEATDISSRVLETARRAIYSEEDLRLPDPSWRARYFQRGIGSWKGYWRVKPEIQSRVRFQRWNLLETPYPFQGLMDVIFCRNVMIYFERQVQQTVVNNLVGQLRPGGYLFVGHSESVLGMHPRLRPLKPSVYRYEPA